jgi:hypothetical protein
MESSGHKGFWLVFILIVGNDTDLRQDSNLVPFSCQACMYPLDHEFIWEMRTFLMRKIQVGLSTVPLSTTLSGTNIAYVKYLATFFHIYIVQDKVKRTPTKEIETEKSWISVRIYSLQAELSSTAYLTTKNWQSLKTDRLFRTAAWRILHQSHQKGAETWACTPYAW